MIQVHHKFTYLKPKTNKEINAALVEIDTFISFEPKQFSNHPDYAPGGNFSNQRSNGIAHNELCARCYRSYGRHFGNHPYVRCKHGLPD